MIEFDSPLSLKFLQPKMCFKDKKTQSKNFMKSNIF